MKGSDLFNKTIVHVVTYIFEFVKSYFVPKDPSVSFFVLSFSPFPFFGPVNVDPLYVVEVGYLYYTSSSLVPHPSFPHSASIMWSLTLDSWFM